MASSARYCERSAMTTVNLPQRFMWATDNDMPYPASTAALAEPDGMAFRFGYTGLETKRGYKVDEDVPLHSSERGISFRKPVFDNTAAHEVESIVETMHLGRDKQTFGCSLQNASYHDGSFCQMTVAPSDWKIKLAANDKDDLNKAQLGVVGNILCWNKNINKINYTLSHHCETDTERDWNLLAGRLTSWTGQPGGTTTGSRCLTGSTGR